MRILLVRHGEKAAEPPLDADRPLRDPERVSALRLLERINFHSTLIIASPSKHALETAAMLAEPVRLQVVSFQSLAPRDKRLSIDDVLKEAKDKGVAVGAADSILLVGHEPHLSQLLETLTARRWRPFERLEGVMVEADSEVALSVRGGNVRCVSPLRSSEAAARRRLTAAEENAASRGPADVGVKPEWSMSCYRAKVA